MIVNAYAILSLFACGLQCAVAMWLTGRWLNSRRVWSSGWTDGGAEAVERNAYLMMTLALVLLGLGLASWPLLYLLLQSYVPSWPGVMCIDGVTRIGTGSLGASRFLPGLLTALQVFKPLLMLMGGAWLVTYLANRATSNAPLMRRLLWGLLIIGSTSLCDGVCTACYLLIPKQEDHLAAGCCTQATSTTTTRSSEPLLAGVSGTELAVVFMLLWAGLLILILDSIRKQRGGRKRMGGLLASTLVVSLLGGLFLVDVLSPALLQRPHHCPYDLVSELPESVIGIVLFMVGSLWVAAGSIASFCADVPETREILPGLQARVLFLGLFSYLGSFSLLSVQWCVL